MTRRLSTASTIGALLALPDKYVTRPGDPATCSPAVESVVVWFQVVGSADPDFHTRTLMVVGEVPVTWVRTIILSFAA